MVEASLGTLGAANIAIRTDLAAFMTSMKTAQAELKKLELQATPAATGIRGAFNSAEQAVTSFTGGLKTAYAAVGTLIAALAVEKLAGMVKSSLEWAQALKDLSTETGLSTSKIQELQFRALQFGISTEQMTTGLLFFSKAFGAFLNDQTGPGAKAFEALGVKAGILNGTIRNAGDALDVFATHLQNYKSVNEAAAFTAEAFGRNLGPRFVAVLRQSGDEAKRATDEMKRMGFVVGDDVVNAAAEANVRLNILWEGLQRDFTTEIAKLVPEIKAIADELIADLPAIKQWVDEWLVWFGAIDKNSDLGLRTQLADVNEKIAETRAALQKPIVGWMLKTPLDNTLGQLLAIKQELEGKLIQPVKITPEVTLPPPEAPLHLGASKAELDAAKKLAEERKALLEKIVAYDAAMGTADDKAAKEYIAAVDAQRIKAAELTGDKEAQFAAQIQAAHDAAAAELAVLMAENDQQVVALNKLNDEYRKLFGVDLPGYLKQLQAITDETNARISASYTKSQTDIEGIVHDRVLYENEAANQIRDGYAQALDDAFQGIVDFARNGGNALTALYDVAKKVSDDIANAFIKLAIENPIINSLLGPNPTTGQLLPTIGFPGMGGKDILGNAVRKPTGNPGDPLHVTMDGLGGLPGGGSSIPGLNGAGNPFGPSIFSQLFGSSLPSDITGGGDMITSGLTDVASAGMSGAGGILSFLTDALSFIGLADGGPVRAGDAYMVGEEGPELFLSDRSGQIVPRDQLGAIGGDTHVHAHFHGLTDGPSVLRAQSQIESMLARAVTRGQRST